MPPTAPGSLISSAANYLTVEQAFAQPSMVPLAGTVVDWAASAGGLFRKFLEGNTTFTFANVVTGDSIRIFLTRTAASGHTITWPSGITWTGGAATPVDAPGHREILLTCTGTGTYAGSHASRANTSATSGVPGPPAPTGEFIAGGTPASPAAPRRLINDLRHAGTGAIIAGATDPAEANGLLLELPDLVNGFPAWTSDGYSDATPGPRYWLRKTGAQQWQVYEQETDLVLFSYYDFADAHPTPFTVPNWTEEDGTGDITVTRDAIVAAGELIDGGTPATPAAPGELV